MSFPNSCQNDALSSMTPYKADILFMMFDEVVLKFASLTFPLASYNYFFLEISFMCNVKLLSGLLKRTMDIREPAL